MPLFSCKLILLGGDGKGDIATQLPAAPASDEAWQPLHTASSLLLRDCHAVRAIAQGVFSESHVKTLELPARSSAGLLLSLTNSSMIPKNVVQASSTRTTSHFWAQCSGNALSMFFFFFFFLYSCISAKLHFLFFQTMFSFFPVDPPIVIVESHDITLREEIQKREVNTALEFMQSIVGTLEDNIGALVRMSSGGWPEMADEESTHDVIAPDPDKLDWGDFEKDLITWFWTIAKTMCFIHSRQVGS